MAYRTISIQVARGSGQWSTIDKLCYLSKSMYNSALYLMRQDFENGVFNFNSQHYNKLLIGSELYSLLPNNSSQQVVQQVHKAFVTFFKALKKYKTNPSKFTGMPRIPKYKHKTDGRNALRFSYNQAKEENGFLKFPKKCGLKPFKLPKTNVSGTLKYVEITPHHSHYTINIVCKQIDVPLKPDNGRYATIDLGVKNLATITINCDEPGRRRPYLVNGGALKSVNQFYNKKRAKMMSEIPQGKRTSRAISKLTRKRNNKVNNILHHASKWIAEHCHRNNVCKVAIGLNKGWKQEVNLGNANNQTFVGIPHGKFIEMLQYKLGNYGIELLETNEAYTSKCSFLDGEEICKHDVYLGKRVKRGLFRTSGGFLLNADVNGSLNIMRKVFGDAVIPPADRGFIGNPERVNVAV